MSVDHDYAFVTSTGTSNGANIQSSSQGGRMTTNGGGASTQIVVGTTQRVNNVVTTADGRQLVYARSTATMPMMHRLVDGNNRQVPQGVRQPVQQRILFQQPGGGYAPLQRTNVVVVSSAGPTHSNMQFVSRPSAMGQGPGQPVMARQLQVLPQQQFVSNNVYVSQASQQTANSGGQTGVFQAVQQQIYVGQQDAPEESRDTDNRETGSGQVRNVQHMDMETTTIASGHVGHMNLTVPMREPTPEPVMVKEEQPDYIEDPQPSNPEPLPDASSEEIDIQIRNVVCNYTLPLHIDLRKLALHSNNVTYDRGRGVMMKQKRNPNCYIKVYSSGKVYIVGCRSEVDCRRAARTVARHIQRVMGKQHELIRIRNYRVNNVLATCRMPFGIKIEDLAQKYPANSQYEPELSVGLVWRSVDPKATLRIHTTGSITVTGAHSEDDVMRVIQDIWPIVLEFRCSDRARGKATAKKRRRAAPAAGPRVKRERLDDDLAYGNSGVMNNKVYFSDEDDIYDDEDLDLEDE